MGDINIFFTISKANVKKDFQQGAKVEKFSLKDPTYMTSDFLLTVYATFLQL